MSFLGPTKPMLRLCQLPTETIVTPVSKSHSTSDLEADINFAGNRGAMVYTLFHNDEGIVAHRNLGFDTPRVPTCLIHTVRRKGLLNIMSF